MDAVVQFNVESQLLGGLPTHRATLSPAGSGFFQFHVPSHWCHWLRGGRTEVGPRRPGLDGEEGGR